MGQYIAGDVILAPVCLARTGETKTRPLVVVAAKEGDILNVCPVSSRPPSDLSSVPLTLDDFVSGGLDMFDESYVLTRHICRIRVADVIAKKGHLAGDILGEILTRASVLPGL